MPNIDKPLLTEIEAKHAETAAKVAEARKAHDEAIHSAITTAALVEKCQRIHKRDLLGFLSGIMPADEVKKYQSLARVYAKRDVKADKLMLQKLGILDMGAAPPRNATARPSLQLQVARRVADLKKAVEKRGVASMTASEREAIKSGLEPLARLYVELERS